MKVRSLLVVTLVVMGVFVLGCKKEEPVATPTTDNTLNSMTESMKDAADTAAKDAEKAAADAKVEADKMAEEAKAEAQKAQTN